MDVLRINGKEKSFPEGIPPTLAELLDQLGISQATVMAQLDGTIVTRDKHAETTLSPGQSLELIRIMGGG